MTTDMERSADLGDELLVSRSIRGDRESLQVLYSRYFPRVYQMCFSFARNRDDAFDLTHDILIKAFSKVPTFKGTARFSTWLYSIAHNHCISQVSRRKRVYYEDIEAAEELVADNITGDEYEDRSRKEERECSMDKYLDLLPETEKQMLVLKYQGNYSIRDLQEEFNLSASAVKMRLMRAKQKISAQV